MPVRVAEPLLGGEQVRPGQVPAQLAGDPLSRLIPVGPGLQRAAYRGDEPGQPGAGLSGDEGHRSSCDLTQLNRMVVTSPDCPTLTGRRMIGRGSGPGVVMTPERRHALLAWARDRYAIVIEDDYDSEFRYDREPIGTLQGLAPDRVALLGSVSKSLAPALRLGWIACPPQLSGPLAHGKRYNDRGCPALDHLALAALIESGRFDRHVRRMRALYAARRDALGRTLRAHAPGVALSGLAAGLHAVATLPSQADEQTVIDAARARSVGLHGMSAYRFDGAATPAQLVLGFGNLTEDAIKRGVAAVADLLR